MRTVDVAEGDGEAFGDTTSEAVEISMQPVLSVQGLLRTAARLALKADLPILKH